MKWALLLLLAAAPVRAEHLSAEQQYWAIEAYRVGEVNGEGIALSALAGQESSWCKFKINSWSRGCLGIKRKTARAIFDSQATRQKLTEDNEYNLRAGLAILNFCRWHTSTWRRAIACYHYGLPEESIMLDSQIDSDPYIHAIIRRMKYLESLPVSHE